MARSDVAAFRTLGRPVVFGSSARFKILNAAGYLVVPILGLGLVGQIAAQGSVAAGWGAFGIVFLFYLYYVVGVCWNAMVLRGTFITVRTVFPYSGTRIMDLSRSTFVLRAAGTLVLAEVPSLYAGKADPELSIRADGATLRLTLRRGLAPDKLLALAAAITARNTDGSAEQAAAALRQWADESRARR